MINYLRRYAVAAAFAFAFCAAVTVAGNTLATVQNRQAHEIQAIQCLLDVKCAAMIYSHQHAHAHQPTATTPTRTLI
jgi:hypothetical protein